MFFFLFSLLALMVLAGIVLGAVAFSRSGSSAVEVLRQRLARGEVTAEEYRERLELLGGGGGIPAH